MLSGFALLAMAYPAFGQSNGLGSSGLGSSGLGSSGLGGGSGLGGSGGSFIGGSTSGSGSSGSFIGGSTGGSSGSFLGATSGTSSTSSSGSQSVGGTTFLGPYFGNPLSLGLSTNGNNSSPTSSQYTFGVPLYTVTGTNGGTGSSYLGLAGSSGSGSLGGTATASNSSFGATSMGTRRAPSYTTQLGFTYKPESPAHLQTDLQQVIARSNRLAAGDKIQVLVDGQTIVLRGTVTDDHDRRLAEALVRLTPGVHDLRNELAVGSGPTAASGP
jgi:hypothetical protein